ncbi:hypothetical protein BH10ACT7_BH10ACT7_04850 [soil metagenome]
MSLPTLARVVVIAIAVLNVVDIIVHVLVDDVEPLRVTGNVVAIAAALALLLWPRARRALTPLIAAAVNLGLNIVFIALQGIGPLGVILIAVTTVLLVVVAVALRRRG